MRFSHILRKGGIALIRRNQAFLNRINVLLDFLVIISAYYLASWFWLDVMDGRSDNMAAISGKTIALSCLYALLLLFTLSLFDFYGTTRTRRLTWKIRTIFIATSVTVLLTSTLFYVFRLTEFSRGVLSSFYLFLLVLFACVVLSTHRQLDGS